MEKPKIRFKSFEKRWESYRLSEYSNYRRGSFPQPYGNKEWYGGDNAMPFVQVVDVLENLRLVADTKQKISTLAQPMSVFVPSDSVIVTLQGSIGRVAITQYDAYVDRTILIFEDYNSQTNKEFWAYTIRNKFEIERQKAPGGTIKTITKEALSDFKVSIPEYTEQSAIGSLFRNLDDLLISYKNNLANYQSLKATKLSKMFPKAGQTVPEIRLDGFEGEWELLEINDLADDFQSGGTPKTNIQEYWDGDIPWIQSSDLETNCLFEIKVQKSISEKGLKNSSAKIIPKDSIAVVTRVGVGKLAVMRHEYATSQDFLSLSNLKSNIEFTAYLLYRLLQKEVTQLQGTSIKGITKVELLSKKVLIPSLSEQQAIGSYLLNLDNLIVAHQEKISQLETLKKKLLQDMFI